MFVLTLMLAVGIVVGFGALVFNCLSTRCSAA